MPRTNHWKSLLLFFLSAIPFFQIYAAAPNLEPATWIMQADTTPSYFLFAGLSPNMIIEGQWEINLYNALSTQKLVPALANQEVYRSSSLQQALQVWHNPFRSNRVNVGLGFRFGHQLTDQQEDRSPLRVLGSGDEQSTAFHALTAVGPSVRFIPIRTLPELSIQSSFLFPVAKELITRQALGWDRSAFLLQGAFQQRLNPWLYGFVSTGTTLLFKNDDRMQTTLSVPTALYLAAQIAQSNWYVIPDLSYTTSYNDRFQGSLRHVSSQWLGGLGIQYYPSPSWTFFLLWERSLGMNIVGSTTEFINRSFNQVSLGVRYLTQ